MLYSLDNAKIKNLPRSRQADYGLWRSRLDDDDYDEVVDAINEYIEGKEVFISSHIPGKHWQNTVFYPLYEACNRSQEQAGWFFGLIVWETIITRDEKWFFKPADGDGDDILGMTYFQEQ